ncbi:ABC transporter ATP-binding protein [bacterium AH-315-P07]|nr:ABC transporter ATP-binding protein [bacterium AH-315-P07]
MSSEIKAVLSVKNLKTYFYTERGVALAVDDVSFEIPEGKTLALVGESGCGKSMTALSILGLIPDPPGKIVSGSVLFEGRDLVSLPPKEMRGIRGNDISMIFQEPMTSLNPVFRIGDQIGSILRLHEGLDKASANKAAIGLLEQVGIPAPESRVNDYPHQMSGGMRQRVMIAMALACNPKVLIADEPTTALDVTIQAQILDLLRDLQKQRGMAILLITHDLGVVAEMADEVAIMYAGKIIERGPITSVFAVKSHPYTQGLFNSLPNINARDERLETIKGQVPAATDFPDGCRFHPRCPKAMQVCMHKEPTENAIDSDHTTHCWLYDEDTMANDEKSKPVESVGTP